MGSIPITRSTQDARMNKPLKYALAGLGALVALTVIAAVIFLASFDANRF